MPALERLQPLWARLLIALLVALSAYGVSATLAPQSSGAEVVDVTDTDLALYKAVAARVGAGENYYEVVVAEQRARGYPLRPVVTVRLPTLAWIVATLGETGSRILLHLLALAAILALTVRLRSVAPSKAVWAGATFLAAGSVALLTVPAMTYWHESWSALLIVLSLAARTERRWALSVGLGLAAVLLRELALPYLCLMALLAWRGGTRVEAAAWGGAILIFFAALAMHASALSGLVTAADGSSPGWSSGGGWPFVLAMLHRCTLFAFLPMGLVALFVPLALLGWAWVGGSFGLRGALLLPGYSAAFMLFGRPDNFYWAIMIAPLLPLGLAFSPIALRDLGRAAFARREPAPAAA
jgi:hypothetical protein